MFRLSNNSASLFIDMADGGRGATESSPVHGQWNRWTGGLGAHKRYYKHWAFSVGEPGPVDTVSRSPLLKLDELSGGHGEDVEGWDNIDDADVLRDPASAEIGSDVFMDEMSGEDGSISQVPVGVPGPRTPTKAEVHKHNLKHIYYRGWCPHCLAGRRQNSQHKSQH